MKKLFLFIAVAFLLAACGEKQPQGQNTPKPETKKTVTVPQFNVDSAYHYVAAQTAFGPRVPETQAHAQCGEWLVSKLSEWADTVIVQDFRTRLFNDKGIDGKNIVSVFHPEAKKRIVLCAHWDSRPYADHDPDEAFSYQPIDGANDGASGHQSHVLALQARAEMLHQVQMARVVLVEFDELDVVDGAFHPQTAQHSARGACVLHHEMPQPPHGLQRAGGKHPVGTCRTQQVGDQVKRSESHGYNRIFFSISAIIDLNCLSVSMRSEMVLQA